MKKTFKIIAFTVFVVFIISSCKKDDPRQEELDRVSMLNHWIWDAMNDIYLWADEIPPSLYPDNEPDPEAFFYKLLNEKDRFSWIVDDVDALRASFAGKELHNGISPGWLRLPGTDRIIVAIEYVYEGSPAADSGFKRGDIIMEVNGEEMSIYNYASKFYQQSASYGFGKLDTSGLVLTGESKSLNAIDLDQNPVQHHEIIEFQATKIGYLVYTHFTGGSENNNYLWMQKLNEALENFKGENVDDIIVDLRYNPGGSNYVAEHIAAALAPKTVVDEHEVFTRHIWNEGYNKFFREADYNEDGKPDGEDWLVQRFQPNDYNLGLMDVYFLTSFRSASACELVITGLEPYTNVVHVGDTTRGKYLGSYTIDDTEDPPRHKWAMQPIVFKYANASGFTNFDDGLIPDFPIRDNLLYAVPFGDVRDPMLAKALEEITGVSPVAKKSMLTYPPYVNMPDPRKELVSRALRMDKALPSK